MRTAIPGSLPARPRWAVADLCARSLGFCWPTPVPRLGPVTAPLTHRLRPPARTFTRSSSVNSFVSPLDCERVSCQGPAEVSDGWRGSVPAQS